MKPSVERTVMFFGCSAEQAKAQMKRNADSLLRMAEQAAQTGRKVNNYTEEQLRAKAANYLEAIEPA